MFGKSLQHADTALFCFLRQGRNVINRLGRFKAGWVYEYDCSMNGASEDNQGVGNSRR